VADKKPIEMLTEWVRRIRHIAETQLMPDGLDRRGACIPYAGAAHAFLDNLFQGELEVTVAAGSMQWPILDFTEDDGVCNTHFSYMFGQPRSQTEIALFGLPEVHAWCEIRTKGKVWIVDVTSCYLKEQQARLTEDRWTAPDPPDFVWHDKADLEKAGVYYQEDDRATMMVLDCLIRLPLPEVKGGAK
jgi:hypothetical protein